MGASTSRQHTQQNLPTYSRPRENYIAAGSNTVSAQNFGTHVQTVQEPNYNTSSLGLRTSAVNYTKTNLGGLGQRTTQSALKENYRVLTRQIVGLGNQSHPNINTPVTDFRVGGPRQDFAHQVQDHFAIREQTNYTLKNINSIFAKDNINLATGTGPIYNIKQYNATYQGGFDRGVPSGRGVAHFRDGGYYSGDFVQGDANGYGVYIYPNGSVYEGQFARSQFNGKGSLIYVDKRMRYDGDFVDGLPQGLGTETYSEGDRYQGQFNRGLKQGYGTYVWANGLKYEGNWDDGLMHGNGVILNGSNVVYQGGFHKGGKSGRGVFRTEKGSYEGEFRNDYLEGPGSFFWNDGRLYVGRFRNTLMDDESGEAKIYYPNGQIAGGLWKNNHNKQLTALRNDPSAEAVIRQYRARHEEGFRYRSTRPGMVASGTGSQIRYGESNLRNQESYQSDLSSSDRGVVINRTSTLRNSNSNNNLPFSSPKAHELDFV